MESRGSFAAGLGIGAVLMYWLDPERGRRRRALVRDQVIHAARISRDAVGATSRDVMHRTSGTAASIAGALSRSTPDDDVLVARVRAKLGRVVSHPHAVDVSAAEGVVTISGAILKAEMPQLLQTVRAVRGVHEVVNALEEHSQAGGVPALQGGATPAWLRADVWQERRSPATRLLVGVVGAGLMAYCGNRRDTRAMLMGTLGFGLCARALINVDMGRLTGLSRSRRAVDIQKTITADAPV
ncbi:MAG: BON domain-containing protein [Acidobacteria bacterium]|nr:BON domain-containing protein [Acidobacteriota bacterium]